MKHSLLLSIVTLVLSTAGLPDLAEAREGSLRGAINHRQSLRYPWHGNYYNTTWGAPVALVVPPNVENQTHWGWGVGNTRVTPIRHQFGRSWPGQSQYNRDMFQHTPRWPADTDQFGTYYIRGPW